MTSRLGGLVFGILAAGALGSASGCNYSFAVLQVERVCDNGKDDDGDGLTDCFDPDCANQPVCVSEWDCTDGVDNDADGAIDCADGDCADAPDCQGETVCWDGLDDDGDGLTDCDDEECADQVPCLATKYACDADGSCEEEPEGWTGDATGWEDRRWCSDCQVACSLDGDGEPYHYIATRVEVPFNKQLGRAMGYDMDGNGDVDNDLASVLAYMNSTDQQDLQAQADRYVQDGLYILLGRLHVASWPEDDSVAVQIFAGDTNPTHDATEDNLTGEGEVLIDDNASGQRELFLCGTLEGGALMAGPGRIWMPIPLFYDMLYVPLDPAWIFTADGGYVTETEWRDVIIAGGMDQQALEDYFYPQLARYLSLRYKEDPNSNLADFLRTWVDGQCAPTNPGCEDVQEGVGECAPYDGTNDPVISKTEVQCSALGSLFQPKTEAVRSDGTVTKVFTMGFRVTAVRVRIAN